MKISYSALGPLGQIFMINKSGVTGKCVASFWPASGAENEILIKLKTTTGAICEVPLFSAKRASDKQQQDYIRESRIK